MTLERRGAADARDATRNAPIGDDEIALAQTLAQVARELESDQRLAARTLRNDGETALADEELLVHLDRPGHIELERIGDAVGVLADDDVSLLEPQHALRLHTEGPDPVSTTRLVERAPQLSAVLRGRVDLIAQLAHEPDAHEAAGYRGDERLAHAQIRECALLEIEARQCPQDLARRRPGKIEGSHVPGEIDESHGQTPPGGEPAELTEQRRGVSRRRGEIE